MEVTLRRSKATEEFEVNVVLQVNEVKMDPIVVNEVIMAQKETRAFKVTIRMF